MSRCRSGILTWSLPLLLSLCFRHLRDSNKQTVAIPTHSSDDRYPAAVSCGRIADRCGTIQADMGCLDRPSSLRRKQSRTQTKSHIKGRKAIEREIGKLDLGPDEQVWMTDVLREVVTWRRWLDCSANSSSPKIVGLFEDSLVT